MKYLIIKKDETNLSYNRNNAVECAIRTLGKILGRKPYVGNKIMMLKVPDKMGDMTLVARFYQRFPTVCSNNSDIYTEKEGADYYLTQLNGSKVNAGYGLATYVCEEIHLDYELVDEKDVQ